MALPQRTEPVTAAATQPARALTDVSAAAAPTRHGFDPGGPVGQMHADLTARLTRGLADTAMAPARGERLVRFVSVAGGYAALAAAYAGVAVLFLR